MRLLQHSVAESTQERYAPTWRIWTAFLTQIGPLDTNAGPVDAYVPFNTNPFRMARLLAMFVHYLTTDLHKSAESSKYHLTALKYHLRSAGCNTEAFENPQLQACKRAIMIDPQAYHGKRKQVLPIPLDCVESIVQHFESGGMRKRIIAVAAALAFCCLMRPSEYCCTTNKPNADKHVIRAAQVLFERAAPTGRVSTFHSAASLPHDFLFAQCVSVKITFLTAKNIAIRSSKSVWFSATSTTRINLPRILFAWAKDAQLAPQDFFMSFRTSAVGTSSPLDYSRFKGVLRYTGRLFGIMSHVAGHGLRIGGATHLRASGADDGTIMLMGRWRSLPASLGYQASSTATHDRLLHLLSTPGSFTARDIRLSQAAPPQNAATSIAHRRNHGGQSVPPGSQGYTLI